MYNIISKYCPEFGEVRTIKDEYGTIWYCATDIIRILGYNVNNSINVYIVIVGTLLAVRYLILNHLIKQ